MDDAGTRMSAGVVRLRVGRSAVVRLGGALRVLLLCGFVGETLRREVQVFGVLRCFRCFTGFGSLKVPGIVQRWVGALNDGRVLGAGAGLKRRRAAGSGV